MPDPISQLTEEHNRLRRLFKQIPPMGGHQSVSPRATAICDLWTIHSRLEEELIYPEVKNLDANLASEAEAAHQQAQAIIDAIKTRNYADDSEVKADIDKLEHVIEPHTRWEEEVVYPKVSALEPAEVDRIGSALYRRNQELMKEYPGALGVAEETEGYIASPRI